MGFHVLLLWIPATIISYFISFYFDLHCFWYKQKKVMIAYMQHVLYFHTLSEKEKKIPFYIEERQKKKSHGEKINCNSQLFPYILFLNSFVPCWNLIKSHNVFFRFSLALTAWILIAIYHFKKKLKIYSKWALT